MGTSHDAGPGAAGVRVSRRGGRIWCESKPPGKGSTFVPPCNSPFRTAGVSILDGLNSGNVSDDSESALVQDVQAAMACDPFRVMPVVLGAMAAASVAAIGAAGGVLAWRRRRNG
ncbi:MAG: hypothetical protein HYT80_05355 [Euryarchaeota archaeon]|nr:hypothetical protein [Euryarchaeota archaeon]